MPIVKFPLAALLLLALSPCAFGQTPRQDLMEAAQREQPRLIGSLEQFCAIESDSRNTEGLAQMADLLAARLRALGGEVEILPTGEVYRMEDTPAEPGRVVKGVFRGTGTKKLLLLAHMDTVYPKGTGASQPFAVKDDKVYGLAIADDKQGLAVVLHVLAMLKAVDWRGYGEITVLFNGDEEISSPASRDIITASAQEADAVMSFEGSGASNDKLSLATAGIASVMMTVYGRAEHAGGAPQDGVNALYEMAHQVLQMRDLTDPAIGLRLNWTMAKAGVVRNMVPPLATAEADIRALRVRDYLSLEKTMQERIQFHLLPEAQVTLKFERRRPPLEATAASRALGDVAKKIYLDELGLLLNVDDEAEGGGTDAGFAGVKAKGPVIERFGLRGAGAHGSAPEYVLQSSIVPRLYLAARVIQAVSEAGGTR
ncbi:glutamate carboxypeptidase [Paucibacter sp. R3-3]|uniref:Glutamate carboxypeptidase n=1 Tax=Roseateles agri TaxID=3098619 RepID=A0ABU5DLJ0_9BURK|nr:glutamate carboxypeptidase [Paucibacter sp. R3-3]MDY0747170.1 glutamate carboxypeptidase [Paucibacter sp. R3-3]